MPDGTDGKLSLQILKCLLNAGQKQIRFPDGFRRSGLHVGTKQIASLTPQRSPQAFAVQFEMESAFLYRFQRIWERVRTSPKPRPASFFNAPICISRSSRVILFRLRSSCRLAHRRLSLRRRMERFLLPDPARAADGFQNKYSSDHKLVLMEMGEQNVILRTKQIAPLPF